MVRKTWAAGLPKTPRAQWSRLCVVSSQGTFVGIIINLPVVVLYLLFSAKQLFQKHFCLGQLGFGRGACREVW